MVEFAYNNAENTIISHIFSELNCSYHPHVFLENVINSRLRSHLTNKQVEKLGKLILICQQNLLQTQELQQQAHDKGVKSQSYASEKKTRLHRK